LARVLWINVPMALLAMLVTAWNVPKDAMKASTRTMIILE